MRENILQIVGKPPKRVPYTAAEEAQADIDAARTLTDVAAEKQERADVAAAVDAIPALTDAQRVLLKAKLGAAPEEPDEDIDLL